MNFDKLNQLLSFQDNDYKGVALTRQEFNLLRELHSFKMFSFDNLLHPDVYETWVSRMIFEDLIMTDFLTVDEFAEDVAFLASHTYLIEKSVDKTRIIIAKCSVLFQEKPSKFQSQFLQKVTNNIGKLVDVYA